jgi:hexosaminidase
MEPKYTWSLLPTPRHLRLSDEHMALPPTGLIALDGPDAQATWPTAVALQTAVREASGAQWQIVAGTAVPAADIRALLSVVPGGTGHAQGYELSVADGRIHAVAGGPAGLFYAVQTLCQLLSQGAGCLPLLRCRDWPDFPHRGVMLDISRDKVPTLETLYSLVDTLAAWKINQLQLYTEHTFAYRRHPAVWADASPLTG